MPLSKYYHIQSHYFYVQFIHITLIESEWIENYIAQLKKRAWININFNLRGFMYIVQLNMAKIYYHMDIWRRKIIEIKWYFHWTWDNAIIKIEYNNGSDDWFISYNFNNVFLKIPKHKVNNVLNYIEFPKQIY